MQQGFIHFLEAVFAFDSEIEAIYAVIQTILGEIFEHFIAVIYFKKIPIPAFHVELDIDRLFGSCPNTNCIGGEISWHWWRSGSAKVRAGAWDFCGSWAVECPECGELVDFFFDETERGCGAVVSLIRDRKGSEIEEIGVRIADVTTKYEWDEMAP